MNDSYFADIDYFQIYKNGEQVGGDVFDSKKHDSGKRAIAVLADGLGSGIKANVLATLTTTMALSFIQKENDIKRTAEVIMSTLPVCKSRKIAYSTFTILDLDRDGNIRIIE